MAGIVDLRFLWEDMDYSSFVNRSHTHVLQNTALTV